jgi:hypothetical protein
MCFASNPAGELCGIESPDDGLTFLPDSVHVDAIREDQEYGGMRVNPASQ